MVCLVKLYMSHKFYHIKQRTSSPDWHANSKSPSILNMVAFLKENMSTMHINLNSKVITLMSAMIHPIHKKWLGFARLFWKIWELMLSPCSKSIELLFLCLLEIWCSPKWRKVTTSQKHQTTSNYTSTKDHSLDGWSQLKHTMKEGRWSTTNLQNCAPTHFAFVMIASLAIRDFLLIEDFPIENVFLHTNVTSWTDEMEGATTISTRCAQQLAFTIVI